MKLLVLTPYYPPDLGPSAPLVGMLCEDLVQMGHDVTVIAAAPHYPSGQVAAGYGRGLWQWEVHGRVRVGRAWVPSGKRASLRHRMMVFAVYQVLATVMGLGQRYDAVLATNPALETGLPFIVHGWMSRKPGLFGVWDLYPEAGVQFGVFRNRIVIWLVKALEDLCLRKASAIQALADGFVANLRSRAQSGKVIEVIPPWLDTDFIQPINRENTFSQEHGLTDCFVVLHAGNLGLSQGLDFVLLAARSLQDREEIRFVFVGEGPQKRQLMAQSEQMSLQNVVFMDYQPRERLPEVLGTGDVSLISQSAGGGMNSLPSKTFPALASGRALLAVTDPGSDLWKLVMAAQAGVCVSAGDAETLAKAVLQLADDPEGRAQMGNSGREYAVRHFERKEAARRFEALLIQVYLEHKQGRA